MKPRPAVPRVSVSHACCNASWVGPTSPRCSKFMGSPAPTLPTKEAANTPLFGETKVEIKWDGPVIKRAKGRKYYNAVIKSNDRTAYCFRVGDDILVQAPDSFLPYVAHIEALFSPGAEEGAEEDWMATLQWYYRREDCEVPAGRGKRASASAPAPAAPQELFASLVKDDNSVETFLRVCYVFPYDVWSDNECGSYSDVYFCRARYVPEKRAFLPHSPNTLPNQIAAGLREMRRRKVEGYQAPRVGPDFQVDMSALPAPTGFPPPPSLHDRGDEEVFSAAVSRVGGGGKEAAPRTALLHKWEAGGSGSAGLWREEALRALHKARGDVHAADEALQEVERAGGVWAVGEGEGEKGRELGPGAPVPASAPASWGRVPSGEGAGVGGGWGRACKFKGEGAGCWGVPAAIRSPLSSPLPRAEAVPGLVGGESGGGEAVTAVRLTAWAERKLSAHQRLQAPHAVPAPLLLIDPDHEAAALAAALSKAPAAAPEEREEEAGAPSAEPTPAPDHSHPPDPDPSSPRPREAADGWGRGGGGGKKKARAWRGYRKRRRLPTPLPDHPRFSSPSDDPPRHRASSSSSSSSSNGGRAEESAKRRRRQEGSAEAQQGAKARGADRGRRPASPLPLRSARGGAGGRSSSGGARGAGLLPRALPTRTASLPTRAASASRQRRPKTPARLDL